MEQREMNAELISRLPVVEQVEQYILRMISSGQYQPGDKLPSQKELREMLQVSLPTLREALSALSAAGYITGAQGKGYFVNHRRLEVAVKYPLIESDLGTHDIRNVLETRIVMESMLARMASVFATDEECEKLVLYAEEHQGEANARGFYELMADIAHNEMLADIERAILRVVYDTSFEIFRIFGEESFRKEHEEVSQKDIAEAIRSRTPEQAYRRAFLHLKAYTDHIGVKVRYAPMIEPFWK